MTTRHRPRSVCSRSAIGGPDATEGQGCAAAPLPPQRKPSKLGRSALLIALLTLGGCGASKGPTATTSSPSKSKNAASPPIIEPGLAGQPGVVSLLRLPAPSGVPKTVLLTGEIVKYHDHSDLCLYANQMSNAGGRSGGYRTGRCVSTAALPHRGLVTVVTAGWCTPQAVELVWGIAGRNVAVELTSPPGGHISESRLPSSLYADGELFHGFAYGAPVRLAARSSGGHLVASDLVNEAISPYGCGPRTIGPSPTTQPQQPTPQSRPR